MPTAPNAVTLRGFGHAARLVLRRDLPTDYYTEAMATYIQQLAAKTDPLRLVVQQGGKLAPRKLVPTHIEQLISYKPGRPPEQLKKELGIEKFINLASNGH
jgi:hypothetical protein